ncbi:DUF5691 domain-containing protein [uncultured Roseibium sp.]|uniref:DUF5691 domain-containing protein n=1 Tax=uncultured Roseibium sp. TaxID=1936171 RepID=UPI00260DBF26|nr:DUF5691 domain-containing protein [uncultured Roseibium sp.]
MTELSQSLEKIKSRWMVGGSAAEQAPPELRVCLGGADDPELALLAITAQAGIVAFRSAPSAELTPYAALPELPLPTLPEQHRSIFRRIFALQKISNEQSNLLLHFLASRGYVTHPADFMPSRFDDLPACYGPWNGWDEREAVVSNLELSEEAWDHFLPGERVNALFDMRRQDAGKARSLIEAKAEQLPAEQRLRVIQCLGQNLSQGDIPFLEKLVGSDRSQKVQALATAFLARLGRNLDEAENAQELADFHQAGKKGLINRKTIVSARKLKTAAQRARRSELYEIVSLPGLAAALQMDPDALIASWQFGEDVMDASFCGLVARTGSDGQLSACVDRVLSEKSAAADTLPPLLERLSAEDRKRHLPKILAKEEHGFDTALSCMHGYLGTIGTADLEKAPFLTELLAAIRAQADDEKKTGQTALIQEALFQLGLMADPVAAQASINTFLTAGMSRADAALLILQLNAALTPGDPS